MKIIVGSTNPVKLNAVQHVVQTIYPSASVEGVAVESGVAAQPWGDVETRQGAHNRALAIQKNLKPDWAVGLEGGVQPTEYGLFTCAWCVIIDATGRVGVGGNSCILLPPRVVNALENGAELGTAMDALTGQTNTKHQAGAIGILTNGLISRQSAYETIITMALAPFLNPIWYEI
jgi:inosine/xanthosine triphosphatase